MSADAESLVRVLRPSGGIGDNDRRVLTGVQLVGLVRSGQDLLDGAAERVPAGCRIGGCNQLVGQFGYLTRRPVYLVGIECRLR